MQMHLFHYRQRVTTEGKSETFNDNYINPMNVVSFYWDVNENNQNVLTLFLSNNYSRRFPEQLGVRFVNHMEEWLAALAGNKPIAIRQNAEQHEKPRRRSAPIEVVDEAPTAEGESWS